MTGPGALFPSWHKREIGIPALAPAVSDNAGIPPPKPVDARELACILLLS